jgi:GNAT superfamily N-acetyltransferase
MYPSLRTILEPPARTWRLLEHYSPSDRDAIPVISGRGRALSVRAVTPGDAPLLTALLAGLSERSAHLRFFRPLKDITTVWREAARVAGGNPLFQAALVATIAEDGEEHAVALAELLHDRYDPTMAEFAVVVRDDCQREGIGRMLSQLLIQVAMLRGVRTLRASTLAENLAIHKLLRGLGVPYSAETRRGETTALLRLPRS